MLKQADDNATGNLMPLFDGCTKGSTGDDLITDCAYQDEVYAAAGQLVEDCLNK